MLRSRHRPRGVAVARLTAGRAPPRAPPPRGALQFLRVGAFGVGLTYGAVTNTFLKARRRSHCGARNNCIR